MFSVFRGPELPMSVATPTITIKASKGFGSLNLGELWEYRDLLRFHIMREVKGKYRQMALGPTWIILQPIINMVVLSFIFGRVAKLPSDGIPYPIFTYTALIPWTFFSNSCQFTSGCLVAEMGVISKVYFPRLIVPIASILARLVDFLICFVILIGMMIAFGYYPSLRWLALVPYMVFCVATALTVGFWTASLAVRFRDVILVVRYGMQVAMYLTPVGYAVSNVPQEWLWLFKLNPMFWVIEGFRWALVGKGMPLEPYAFIPIGAVVLLMILGAFVFRRTERTVVDLL